MNELIIFIASGGVTDGVRYQNIARFLTEAGYDAKMFMPNEITNNMIFESSLVVVSRPFSPDHFAMMQYIKRIGIPLISDWDDGFSTIEEHHPAYKTIGPGNPQVADIINTNDLDETLLAPWEWDVKRLAPSFVVACRDNGLRDATAKDVVMTCVRTYRESMAEFSRMKTLELWYQALGADELVGGIKDPDFRKRAMKRLQKERAKSIAEDILVSGAQGGDARHQGSAPDDLPR